ANAHLYPKLTYDSLVDFAPISLLCQSQSVLAVNPKVAAKTVKELLDLARANPGKLNFATAGPATNPHIGGEFFNYLGKIEMTAIHYKGGGPALLATLAGDVDVVVSGISEVMPHALAGKVRALGVTCTKRSPAYPDIPTIAESGLPGYEFTTWHALLAPKGTPAPIIALLNDRVKKALATPEAQKQFAQSGLEIIASSPEELGKYLREESVKWGRVIRERGMKLD
ncbi:MAG: tripartite tricarboxylate transporter substrate-binding protein, partial [Burkholderiales bacterium]